MKPIKKTLRQEAKELTKNQLKIFNSIMNNFPKTSRESAIDIALQGGIRFNFIYK